jgi:putative ABC transport system permease protein
MKPFEPPRRDPARDVDDEIRFHLETRIEELVSRGMPAAEARRRAEEEFGDPARVRAETVRIDERMARRRGRAEWVGDLLRDARVGMRSLGRSPAFTITAVLCAALGIGVTAAVVSAAYNILVRPLPYRDADRLAAIYAENALRGQRGANISYPDYLAWRQGTTAFSDIGIWTWYDATLSSGGEPERFSGSRVAANVFPLLGMRPQLGRGFAPEEETVGRDRVALLSDRLWRRRFGADPALVGRTVVIDGVAHVVVGIMPPGFNFPGRGDLWVPLAVDPARESHNNRYHAGAIGRLKDGVPFERGVADLHAIDARLVRDFPRENEGWRAQVIPMREDLVGDLRQPLQVFLCAVALVLLMVCANVANLMLARAATRGREIAVRTALGASRARLARQLATESLLVAALGGAFGVAIAWAGVRLLRYGFPDQVPPFFVTLQLDGTALAIVALVTLLTGVLFGIVPALRVPGGDAQGALREGARGASGGLHRSRLRRALVVGEITLSVVLMVGATLLARSYRNLAGTDLGFTEEGALTVRLLLPEADYSRTAQTVAFETRLLERLRGLPGVTAAGGAQGLPFTGWQVQTSASVEGAPPPVKKEDELDVHFQYVTPDFFKAMGVSLVRGRWLTDADGDTLNPVVLVNERMVAKAFGGKDAIGQRINIGGDPRWATVVGVIHDYRQFSLTQPTGPAVYYPITSASGFFARWMSIVVRTEGDPARLTPALRAAVKEIDPRIAVEQVQTLEEVVSRSIWRQRLQGNVLGVFAALSLVLACIGLYGVVSYAVAQRTRELGVRMALGATRRDVAWMVLGQSGRLVVTGVVAGLVLALAGARVLEGLLYGVKASDPVTFALVPVSLGVVALVAAALPARRATRVDPIVAMRAE